MFPNSHNHSNVDLKYHFKEHRFHNIGDDKWGIKGVDLSKVHREGFKRGDKIPLEVSVRGKPVTFTYEVLRDCDFSIDNGYVRVKCC